MQFPIGAIISLTAVGFLIALVVPKPYHEIGAWMMLPAVLIVTFGAMFWVASLVVGAIEGD